MVYAGAKIVLNATCSGLPERDYLAEKRGRISSLPFFMVLF